MPSANPRISLVKTVILSALVAGIGSMTAQDETYTLDPFTVQGETNGYTATNSISGTRVNMAIKDIPVPITVITE